MKKGLTIALLMVAMVALAASASAVAPTIGTLPAVIIGDAGQVSGAGTTALHLLKYDNVFNLADPGVISRPQNTTNTANLSIWYSVNTGTTSTLMCGTSQTLATQLTAGEIAALMAPAGGIAPSGLGKTMKLDNGTWLSLIHAAGTVPANVASATPAANGSTEAVLTAKGALATQVVTLYANDPADPLSPVIKPGSGSFVVYSELGGEDRLSATQLHNASTGGAGNGGWVWIEKASGTGPTFQSAPVYTVGGYGFKGEALTSGKTQLYNQIYLSDGAGGPFDAKASNMGGKIFRFTAIMGSDATDATKVPSYRFLYSSWAGAHAGGFQVQGADSGLTATNINAPTVGNDAEVRAYWAVPTTTAQYADGEKAATVGGSIDYRDYYIFFDIVSGVSTDTGSIVIKSAKLEVITRPAEAAAAAAYGTTVRNTTENDVVGKAFNAGASAWVAPANDGGTGWGQGTVSVAAAQVSVSMKATPTSTKSVFQQVNPPLDASVGDLPWNANQLVRMTYSLNSSDAKTAPWIRLFTIPWEFPFTGFPQNGSTIWVESINPGPFRGLYPASLGLDLALSPKTTGSKIETYIYTMKAPTVPCILTPALDIDAPLPATYPTNGWAKPSAAIRITGFMMEALSTN